MNIHQRNGTINGSAPSHTRENGLPHEEVARRVEAYLGPAIAREIEDLATTHGHRNHALNDTAFAIGQLVAGAENKGVSINHADMLTRLEEAARANGLAKDDGLRTVRGTIRSGFEAGLKKPRDLAHVGGGSHRSASSHGQQSARGERTSSAGQTADADRERKRAAAMAVWEASSPLAGTPAEAYLRSRGIPLERLPSGWDSDLRYHPECPFGYGEPGEPTLPALVALLRDPLTGKPVGAIQRTFIRPDGGGKATEIRGRELQPSEKKKGLGQYAGTNAAVVLGKTTGDRIIAEGIEDALSVGRPAVAVLSASRLAKVELPNGGQRVLAGQLKSERDRETWRKAAQERANRGEDIRLAWPGTASDFNDLLRSNGPKAVAVALAQAEAVRPDTTGLEFDDEITLEGRTDYVVKGIIHEGDTAAWYGPSGVGKTFGAMDLAYHIAHGQPWHGSKVQQGAVLYVALEGQRGVKLRMRAYAQEHGSAGRMLARLTLHTPLDKGEAGQAGAKAIVEHARKLQIASNQPVKLIVIDTLARALGGDDENSASDMAAFVERRAGDIARVTGAAVLVVHHPGKDDAKGMRGSSALFAACDAVIKIAVNGKGAGEIRPDDVREVTLEKSKDGESGSRLLSYRLRQVELGIDADGDAITSCVVEPVDTAVAGSTARGKVTGRALAVLNEFDHCEGFRAPRGHDRIPEGAWLVRESDLLEACRRKGIGHSSQEDEKQRKKVEAKAIKAGVDGCIKAGALAHYVLEDSLVYWRPNQVCGSSRSPSVPRDKNEQYQGGSKRVRVGPSGSLDHEGSKVPTVPPPYRGGPLELDPSQERENVVPIAAGKDRTRGLV